MGAVTSLRVPPHSVDAEQAIIGGVLLEPKAWARVAGLKPDDFYRHDHRLIWTAVCEVLTDGLADQFAIIDRLSRRGQLEAVGGRDYIAELVRTTGSAASVESYQKIIREHAARRRLAEAAMSIGRLADGDNTVGEAYEEASRIFGELHGRARVGVGLVESRKLVGSLLDELERRRSGERGLSVGLDDFDRLSYGLDPGDLVVIAGRPGMGKTALLVSIAAHVSKSRGVAVFSAEMPATQLMRRAVALVSGVSQSELRHPVNLEERHWQDIGNAAGAISNRRLWVDDTPAPTLEHLRGEVLALVNRVDVGLVMVDYVQLVQGRGANRYEQLRDVAYGLKALAKEARIPVVMLAQLNRGIESREVKKPRLSDLRDSGAIEEAADIVGMLYCEGYYDREFSMPDVLELSVEKNRNGERGYCHWKFSGDTSRVEPLSDGAKAQYIHLMVEARRRRHAKDDDL